MIHKIDALSFTRRNFLKGLGITAASLMIPKKLMLAAQEEGQNIEGLEKIADELKPYFESIDPDELKKTISSLSGSLKRLSDFVFQESEDDTLDSILDDIESAQKQMWEGVFLATNGSILAKAPDTVWQRLKNTGISHLQFTVYGLEQTHDEFAGRRGAFGNIVATIQRAIDELLGSPIEADYSTVPLEQPEDEPLFEDPEALEREVARLEQEMLAHAERLEFEEAAQCRDRIRYLREKAVLS